MILNELAEKQLLPNWAFCFSAFCFSQELSSDFPLLLRVYSGQDFGKFFLSFDND